VSTQSLVLEAEQAAIFEVGRRHAPAAFEVAVEEVFERSPQGILGALPSRASYFGIRRIVVEARVHGIEDSAGQITVAQPERTRAIAGPMQCRSQQGDLGKVVEMARL